MDRYMGKLVMRNGEKGSKDSIGCDPEEAKERNHERKLVWYDLFDRERDLGGKR